MNNRVYILLAILNIAILLLGCKNTKPTQDEINYATNIINKADSLRKDGILYPDTNDLYFCIDIFNRTKQKELLSTSYFYLGRNYDVMHLDTKEVPCFIQCIETTPKLTNDKGFAYNHFAEICNHQGADSAGIYFRKKAKECFAANKDSNAMISMTVLLYEQYILTNDFSNAELIETQLDEQQMKDNTYILYNLIRALKHLHLNEPESSIAILDKVKQDDVAKNDYLYVYYYWLFGYSMEKLNNIEKAQYYYDMAININSDNANNIKNMVFINRIHLHSIQKDSLFIEKYLNGGSEIHNRIRLAQTEEQKAAYLVEQYYLELRHQEYKQNNIIIWIILIAICIIVMSITIFFISKSKHKINNLENDILTANNKLKNSIESNIKRIDINSLKIIWNNKKKLESFVNSYFNYLWEILEKKYELTEGEIKLCILTLLNFSAKQCSDWLYLSINSVPTKKKRVAKKMKINSASLYTFLLKLIS